ncbi:LexA family protein [Escherichia coli]|uniref:LexA family protein n=1 Tax=Escherichia coli TaxID=562 RepID=UPI000510B85F|nr:LexA family transcriptional regulator [Escherichia coli]HDQ6581455.1 helix-turn-helix domain-containing protein [Escherichia coli O146:H21]HDQ6952334.1 helix-turn-helix domain-containing protein [Escherichia coli Ou:H8]EEC8007120.1 helix-turn-helix domain-containing protein [Escherichia coli]EEC8296748.1 helix-turn-helix domain-containing protein [Escherichia coli]EEC8529637.1 helix-turn-helix domain-containing protein [Escherichia coli]
MNLANRAKKRRTELNLTQVEVAKRAGISQQSIEAIENGKTLKPRNLLALASALECDPKWLLLGGDVVTDFNYGARRVPVLSYVQAGAFTSAELLREEGDFEYILTTAELSESSFALRIRGDSMEPEFKEGDIVIIDTDVYPTPGEFVAACNGSHEATFKKYRPVGIGAKGEEDFELVPLNTDYPICRSWEKPIKIIGTMVEHRIFRRKR